MALMPKRVKYRKVSEVELKAMQPKVICRIR